MASLLDMTVWLLVASERVKMALGCRRVEVYREPEDRGYAVMLGGLQERDVPLILDTLAKIGDERTSEPNVAPGRGPGVADRFANLDLGQP